MAEWKDVAACPDCGEPAHATFCMKPAHIKPEMWQRMTDEEKNEAFEREATRIYRLCKDTGLIFEPAPEPGAHCETGVVVWFNFDDAELGLKHRIGFRRTADGISIYNGAIEHSLGYLDLYYVHSPVDALLPLGPHIMYVIDTAQRDEAVGYVHYLPEGTIIHFEHSVGAVGDDAHRGAFYGVEDAVLRHTIDCAHARRKEHEREQAKVRRRGT